MASTRRNTIRINLVKVPPQLKELESRVPENSPFTKRYGRLLNLATSSFEEKMMGVLFQFFDPKHHYFTFLDYQLVPTMEEFSQLLEVLILNQIPFTGIEKDPRPEEIALALHLQWSDIMANWETRSGVKGFLSKFLIDKAQLFWDDMDFQDFEEVLALLIYGLVLFPNPDQLIDVNVVKTFLSCNLVPTLLGDIMHSLHTHTMNRKGTIMCCIPLLSRWFISHLPQSLMKNEQGLRWFQRLMSLAHSDIHWCSRS